MGFEKKIAGFGYKADLIGSLLSGGKLSIKDAYKQVKQAWKEVKSEYKSLKNSSGEEQ